MIDLQVLLGQTLENRWKRERKQKMKMKTLLLVCLKWHMMEILKMPLLIPIMKNVVESMSLKVLSVKVRLQLFFCWFYINVLT